MSEFTHFDQAGQAHMVDVSAKPATHRTATARGRVTMQAKTASLIQHGAAGKGDVLAVARLAGIMAAKRTSDLIPLCHGLNLSRVTIDFAWENPSGSKADSCDLVITASCQLIGPTGVEMEAMTATAITALTVYDMCKAVDRRMVIGDIHLTHKSGGNSGEFNAD